VALAAERSGSWIKEGFDRSQSALVIAFNTYLRRKGTAMSENSETAILAGGCFWPAQELLRHREGVISTRVGYIGGENDNPTADHHPGHAEAVEVTFDPTRTSYREILEFFFQIHRPDLGEELVGSDYRSEIFVCVTSSANSPRTPSPMPTPQASGPARS
jgi:hypothetical protein